MTDMQKNHIMTMRQQGRTFTDIAAETGISMNTVKTFCRRRQIQVCEAFKETGNKETRENKDNTLCRHCARPLTQSPKQKPRQFCNDTCRHAFWQSHRGLLVRKAYYSLHCAHCGAAFISYGHKERKYCSHACYIAGRFRKAAAL